MTARTRLSFSLFSVLVFSLTLGAMLSSCSPPAKPKIQIKHNDHIVFIGNNLGSRMMNYGFFETEIQLRFPDSMLLIRNMCDGGHRPGFRPHSGRVSPWAFPGAETYYVNSELSQKSGSKGHLETPDEWLTRLEADVILAFFGFNESYDGEEGLDNYKGELQAFIDHSLSQKYNGEAAPVLVMMSPIAFEDLSDQMDVPNGVEENQRLQMYSNAMREVADKNNVLFVDVFNPSKRWYQSSSEPLTIDGMQLNQDGYQHFSDFLANEIFGGLSSSGERNRSMVQEAVDEKNWFWHNDIKIPNGVHVFGRRYKPFGPDNYPAELKKIREMTSIRDEAIWKALKGERMDVEAADAKTSELPTVQTNFALAETKDMPSYKYGEEAISTITMAPGYEIELFASEKEFPDLANPMQLSFDNQGRLWVAVMPAYPHYRPGDPIPDDKLLILEDTDGDGKADKQTVFADGLHIPVGFEFAPEGVYVSQGTNLILLTDTDGDDHADQKEIILSGFDDHDTHHVISAFCADPSGAIYMGEGVFLHTNVETAYGPVRGTNGGFFRYNPQRHHLERTAQLAIPNPWGIAFDDWGQNFFAETSGPAMRWMMPGSVKPRYGVATHKSFDLIPKEHRVRPTSGLEFISSRHFPEEVQGDLLINNNIGFLGMRQHKVEDDGTGYKLTFRQDMVVSSDPNFRPVDMEFAPDGSLYLIDWHNILIGHMQHNARDPLRDHDHGRVYRITYPSRPLVTPAKVAGASIEELFDNLKLPEYRTRYRTRRELRARNPKDVLSGMKNWVAGLDQSDEKYEHHLLEALWVSWGLNQVDQELLAKLLNTDDYRVRTAAVRVLRYTGHQVANQPDLLKQAATDENSRVRLEAIVAASWLSPQDGIPVVEAGGTKPLDDWMVHAHETAMAHLKGHNVGEPPKEKVRTHLLGRPRELFYKGLEIYQREGMCQTCHQADGKGLEASGFPPLANTDWVTGDVERLIKITLNGLMGQIEVNGKTYPGMVPMTPMGGLLNDEEMASVLTYVRNSFGNNASPVDPETVKEVREATKDKTGFYTPDELLK